jgi:hypothetical protein
MATAAVEFGFAGRGLAVERQMAGKQNTLMGRGTVMEGCVWVCGVVRSLLFPHHLGGRAPPMRERVP